MVDKRVKDERTRNWTFIVYPESAPENWREILDSLHIPWIESPLHDKDVNPDGEKKKAHWHILVFFAGKKSYEQMKVITDSLNSPIPQKVNSAKGAVRYLIHLDNPEKYQYFKTDIVAHGGADFEKYLTATGGEKLKILSEIQDWVLESGCVEFSELADYARIYHFEDWYDVVANQSVNYLNAYIRSRRHGGRIETEGDIKNHG